MEFALRHDEVHGRGGKAAAARKFGVSIAAVSGWASAYRVSRDSTAPLAANASPGILRIRKLAEMEALHAGV